MSGKSGPFLRSQAKPAASQQPEQAVSPDRDIDDRHHDTTYSPPKSNPGGIAEVGRQDPGDYGPQGKAAFGGEGEAHNPFNSYQMKTHPNTQSSPDEYKVKETQESARQVSIIVETSRNEQKSGSK